MRVKSTHDRDPGTFSASGGRPLAFEHAQFAHRELVDLERVKARLFDGDAADRQPADCKGADRQRADGDRAKGGGADRCRDHACGGNGVSRGGRVHAASATSVASLRLRHYVRSGLSFAAVVYHPTARRTILTQGDIMPARSTTLPILLLAFSALIASAGERRCRANLP